MSFEGRYIECIGRRKTSVARVRLYEGSERIQVNERTLEVYFPVLKLRELVGAPIKTSGATRLGFSIRVEGGGIKGQAEAIRLGISRCLVKRNEGLRVTLKKEGFLSRDSRRRERKKFGKLSARRSPQWSKR